MKSLIGALPAPLPCGVAPTSFDAPGDPMLALHGRKHYLHGRKVGIRRG